MAKRSRRHGAGQSSRRAKHQPSRKKLGEPIEVTIDALSHDGRGVAKVNGKTLFVWGALPGERVVAQTVKQGRDFDEAEVVSIEQPSAVRFEPKCPTFGHCGGCSLQHLEASEQISAKQKVLADNFARIAKVEPDNWLPPLTADHWGYRRRARFSVQPAKDTSRVAVGFRERSGTNIAAIDHCDIVHPAISRLISPITETITQLNNPSNIRQLEVSLGDGDALAMVLHSRKPPSAADQAPLMAFATEQNVDIYLQAEGSAPTSFLCGPHSAQQRLHFGIPKFDVALDFGPLDFIQVNGQLNNAMVAQTLNLLNPQPQESVLDLFCGLGNFTLPLARQVASVTGVEGDQNLVGKARANAAANDISNTKFHVANLFENQQAAPWLQQHYDAILLDPPRAGAKQILPSLAATTASRIVYVSCHPGTLARDTGTLVHQLGFELRSAGVMDMFPHTAHVESIALFERDCG